MSNSDKVRLILLGDIFFGGDFIPLCYDKGYNPFEDLSKFIKSDDIVMGNIETTFFCGHQRPFRSPLLWSPKESIRFLEYLRLNVACLANNHIMDYGHQSMQRTKQLLSDHHIGSFGAGMNLGESMNPLIVKRNNFTFGFLGFTSNAYHVNALLSGWNKPGSPPMRTSLMIKQIKLLKKQCDFVSICLHWGHEYINVPTSSQRMLAKKVIDAGADLIIGTHPHVMQGYEIIDGKPVFYSLGNFFFPEFETINGTWHSWKEECKYSIVVFVDVLIDKIEIQVLPVKSDKYKVIVLDGEEKNKILQKLNEYNEAIEQGENNRFYIETKKEIRKKRIAYLKNRPMIFLKRGLFLLSLFNTFRFVVGIRHRFSKKDIL